MLYAPFISDYKPFYMQFATGTAVNILDTYKVVVKTHDYPMALKPKDVYNNDWKDRHGDDEYIGANGLYFEAFTFTLECAMFAEGETEQQAINYLNDGVRAFRSALSSGFFKTYDAWTGFGFQKVRLAEFPMPSNDAYDVWGKGCRVIFEVKLKVNDPVTHMVLVGQQILED